jgi:hypothetical protein
MPKEYDLHAPAHRFSGGIAPNLFERHAVSSTVGIAHKPECVHASAHLGFHARRATGAKSMNWTSPTFEEIKMDAEIGSYQEDGEPMPIVQSDEDTGSTARAAE